MKVLLIHTNQEHAPQPVIPLGLCSLAESLEAAGFSTRILDLCFSRHPLRDIQRTIAEWEPWVIGLSVRNLDSGEYLNPRLYLPKAGEFAKVCRDASSATLVIGGPAVSISPRQLLDRLNADFAVVGDGEESFTKLLHCLRDGKETVEISGIMSREDIKDTRFPPAHVDDLRILTPPEFNRWIDVRRYTRNGGHVPIQSKRGCGFRCIYCTYHVIEGGRYRLRSPEAVADEIQQAVKDWGARHFEFVDATFNHPQKHALAVCEAIEKRHLNVELHTTGINPSAVSAELMRAMRRAGFKSIVCSPDSASDLMLKRLRRGFSVQHIEQTATWAHEAGISVLWAFLFGGPGETEDTVMETLSFFDQFLTAKDRILCTIGLRVYTGTELESIAQEEGVITPEMDLTEPVFYFSSQITPQRVLELLDGSKRRSQMVYLDTLQNPIVSMALRAHSMLHLPGPIWSAVPIYNALRKVVGQGMSKPLE